LLAKITFEIIKTLIETFKTLPLLF
jgi:hypothetical protein